MKKEHRIPIRSFIPFLLISFGLAWGVLGLYIFMAKPMEAVFGQLTGSHPLFFLAVYAPAIRGNLFSEPFPFASVPALFVGLLAAAIKGPMEEFGWRGFALPLLQRKFAPIWAGLILGVIWGIWHFPAFLLSGTQQSEWSFTAFFVGCLAISVIVTALFNRSSGSILLSAFFHFQLMNPIFPDAQPYDTYLLSLVAGLVVLWNRKSMFTKEGAVMEVIPNQRRMVDS